MASIKQFLAASALGLLATCPALAATAAPDSPPLSIEEIFSPENKTQKVLDIEVALASAQAELDIIPDWAAAEMAAKGSTKYVSQEDLASEYAVVRHRMVALLNVWQRAMDPKAAEYMHFGATTVDIYDTALVLQLEQATRTLVQDLRALEAIMIRLADEHKNTVMVGRTLGQHALPITFGKKVSTWLGENRRNIERLKELHGRLLRSGILKGAVGSYVGLGEKGIEVERAFARHLGLQEPYADDWHGARDVIAEYAGTLAMISRSLGRVGNELFLLQMTDIGETLEVRRKTAVGSSTMPHKKNPSKSEALVFYARRIPRTAETIADDMINVFERDNTSRTNRLLAEISLDAEEMLADARGLLSNLQVNPEAMRANLDKTGGMILSQRVAFALADKIGKTTANARLHELATDAMDEGITLRQAIERSDDLGPLFSGEQLDALFDATTYTGLAAQQVEAVIAYCREARKQDHMLAP
ncbi:adenylosuccinate lyase family protein [Microbulbifer sp. YPW16]|uniref:class-II fumarase/aspartase family protein n=1 Tax=unclassified Microbulbifer TaxID=2619833 RepID=UPI001E3DE216|nr:adenylosuccinate lyase family protein [Microbulbifer sp. YPW16]UHQ54131.1 adenylosuccinate lyase family protein [Microbulbifer sp. YPW16]